MRWKSSGGEYQTQEGFVSRESIPTESIPAGPLLYGAYAAVWVVLILYVFVLARKLSRVERELQDVSARAGKRV